MSQDDIQRYRVRCVSTIQLLEYFTRLGIAKNDLLRNVKTDVDTLSNPHNWIPLSDFLQVIQNCNHAMPFLTLDDWWRIGGQIDAGATSHLFRSFASLLGMRMLLKLTDRHISRFNNFSTLRLVDIQRAQADIVISVEPEVAACSMGLFIRWAAGILSKLPGIYHQKFVETRILYDQALLKNLVEKLYHRYQLKYSEKDGVVYLNDRRIAERIRLNEILIHGKTVLSEEFDESPPYNAVRITEDYHVQGALLFKKGDIFEAPYGRIRLKWRHVHMLARWIAVLKELNPLTKARWDLLESQMDLADRRFFESEQLRNKEACSREALQIVNEQLREQIVALEDTKAALYKSEEKYRSILANIEEAYFEVDLQGNLTFFNKALCRVLGYKQAELLGMNNRRFMDSENAAKVFETFNSVFRTGISTKAFNWQVIRKDGIERQIETSVNLMRDSDGKPMGFRGVLRDVTESKQAERHLLRSERMAALGDLVAGVAHEISTPLGVALMSASFLRDTTEAYMNTGQELPSDPVLLRKYSKNAFEATSLILTNLSRAADLLNSFKQVAVDQSGEAQRVFDLKKYVDEVLASLRPKYKRSGHLIVVNCDEHIEINSHPGAFSQIITNLVMNSLIHAFDNMSPGTITIDIHKNQEKLKLRYHDSGKGMDAATLSKIFDPFFTTRRGQGGSGLGMHIVYNLVTQKLNGQIECRSTPGSGTEFIIRLPLEPLT